LCDPVGGTEGLLVTVGLRRRWNVCDEEQMRMPEGSEFQSEQAAA